jgi:NitT/TauT family transport system substrate-binding protein
MTTSDEPTPISRRSVLKAAGAVGVAASAGALGRRVFSPAIAGPAPKTRLAWGDIAACHSPLGFGVASGIYAKHNLDVELYPFTSNGQTVIQALATGKVDAGAGLIGDWLKPLEQGFDVKLFVGSHGGCGGLFASEKSGVRDLKGLKGKTIATFVMGASPQTVLQVSIFKAGVDPNADVNWKVAPFDLVGETVARGEADAGIHIDPWAWSIEKKNNLLPIADTQTGYYEGRTCCVLGVNGQFLKANKDRSGVWPRPTSRSTNIPLTTLTKWRSGMRRISIRRG